MPSQRQINAVKELVENGGNKGKALLRAGYKKGTAKTPTKVTESKGFKEASKDFIELLEKERNRLIKAMSIRKLDKVDYEKMANALDKITKNHQLLTGGKTENSEMTIKWEQ